MNIPSGGGMGSLIISVIFFTHIPSTATPLWLWTAENAARSWTPSERNLQYGFMDIIQVLLSSWVSKPWLNAFRPLSWRYPLRRLKKLSGSQECTTWGMEKEGISQTLHLVFKPKAGCHSNHWPWRWVYGGPSWISSITNGPPQGQDN